MSNNERDLIVGGQAVIEGVMMRTPNAYAIAVRKADGTIVNTAAVPGLFPLPTKKRSRDELKKGGTAAAASSIVFALIFNVLLFVAAPLLLTNALFVAAGWANAPAQTSPATTADRVTTPQPETPALRRTWDSVRGY